MKIAIDDIPSHIQQRERRLDLVHEIAADFTLDAVPESYRVRVRDRFAELA